MKRRSIFGAIAAMFGVQAATQGKPLYKPDQCPHCGDMADPYRPTKECCPKVGTAPGNGMVACYLETPPCEPDSRVARCKRCNVAFWQDARE